MITLAPPQTPLDITVKFQVSLSSREVNPQPIKLAELNDYLNECLIAWAAANRHGYADYQFGIELAPAP